MTNTRFGVEFGLLVKRRRAERDLSQDQLAAILWPEKAGPKDHPNKPQLSGLETGKTPNPQEKTVLALCEALGIREDEVNALRLAPPPDPHRIADFLKDTEKRSLEELQNLARRFGEEAPQDRSRTWLLSFLGQKAEDIANLSRKIAALEGQSEGIDNVCAAARAAIDEGRLGEARRLIDDAHDLRRDDLRRVIEGNARLSEVTAEIDLIEGKVEAAFTLFSATADSFAAIGAVEVAKRRQAYAVRLTDHGTRYGGASLALAIRLLDRLLADLPRETSNWDWAVAQNSIAIACQSLGKLSDGPSGAALLSRAVAAYGSALEVFNRNDQPVRWASIKQNLANALASLGERTEGELGTEFFSQAIAAYEEALEVLTQVDHPTIWASTIQNLALAMHATGERIEEEFGLKYISRAIAAYEAALQVFTRERNPVQWGIATQNLAGALLSKGRRIAGEAGIALLYGAVSACEETLEVRTRKERPLEWAMTHQNLGNCQLNLSEHPACDDPPRHLRKALIHVDNCLTIFDPDHVPFYHEKATRLRELILSGLASNL